ncbi:hypothetical protein ACS0TY_010387 [Phlomoides rotata]
MESVVLHGVRICRGAPVISKLFFADDMVIFRRAMITELRKIKEILRWYEEASGQEINLQKSSIMFNAEISRDRAALLVEEVGVRRVPDHAIYLGIPTSIGRSREACFRTVVNRVTKKLKDWNSKTLSQAGKLALVKSVAQAIPTYLMTCFKLPKATIDRIKSTILWGQKEKEIRIHWIGWERLCKPKKDGGLGLRDLGDFNKAILAKQGWRLIQDDTSVLAQMLKARYFPRRQFRTITLGYGASYTWQSILEGHRLLEQGLFWIVGDGSSVQMSREPWIFDGEGKHMLLCALGRMLMDSLWPILGCQILGGGIFLFCWSYFQSRKLREYKG